MLRVAEKANWFSFISPKFVMPFIGKYISNTKNIEWYLFRYIRLKTVN